MSTARRCWSNPKRARRAVVADRPSATVPDWNGSLLRRPPLGAAVSYLRARPCHQMNTPRRRGDYVSCERETLVNHPGGSESGRLNALRNTSVAEPSRRLLDQVRERIGSGVTDLHQPRQADAGLTRTMLIALPARQPVMPSAIYSPSSIATALHRRARFRTTGADSTESSQQDFRGKQHDESPH